MDIEILADSPNIYAVVLPEDGEIHLRCAIINKADTRVSEDGKSVTAYLICQREWYPEGKCTEKALS